MTGAHLTITRGLPGSGKTTWALQQSGAHRVNRDDLRQAMFGASGRLTFDQEEAVTSAQRAAVRLHLAAGRWVIVDDTNLRLKFAREWATLAGDAGAGFDVREFTDVPLEVCLRRDMERRAAGGRGAGEEVIRGMHERFLAAGELLPVTPNVRPPVEPVEPAAIDPRLPWCVIVDLDGTLAHMNGRGPYDWSRVGEDTVDARVRRVVHRLRLTHTITSMEVVVMSGRDSVCEAETIAWLRDNDVRFDLLLMRPRGDTRPDQVVKRELYEQYIRRTWNVLAVLDDRDKVVRMWREELGLLCLQVAPGAF